MNLGKLTYNLLSNDATITGLVGSRIFPVQIPQDTGYTAIVYQHTSQLPTNIKDGPSPLDVIDMSLVIYSTSYSDAQDIAARCRVIFDHYQGTVQGVSVDKISFANQSDNDFIDDFGFFAIEQSYQVRMKR